MDVALLPCWQESRSSEANDVRYKDSVSPTTRRDQEASFYRRTVKSGKPTIGQLRGQTTSEELLSGDEASMPVATGSHSLLTSIPSFMSVFGDGLGTRNVRDDGGPNNQPSRHTLGTGNRQTSHNPSPPSYVYRRGSSGTFKSESTDSSPTTTISTIDSTLTEPSPSSSPESPTLSLPLSSFSSLRTSSPMAEDVSMGPDSAPSSPPPPLSGFSSRADSPNKKMRNTKNLSLNTAGSNRQACASPLPRLATSHANNVMMSHAFSTPASPSFILPPKAPKRKPSTLGLTITTPESSLTNQLHRSISDIVPQTPSMNHLSAFNHMDGASSLPIFSPTAAPEGGMQLPPFGGPARTARSRPALSLSQSTSFDSSRSSPIVLQTLEHVPEENDDPPLSREIRSPAYPEGPVCIYQPNVYLYLEPSDTEASEFDVIINVAREVLNPFEGRSKSAPETQFKDAGVQVNLISEEIVLPKLNASEDPPSAISEKSFRSAFEIQPEDIDTIPDTPVLAKSMPEYVHIPWDHNTNVVNDLSRLCELIDNRVSQGKRVLVHCQCGVSRSASLIVAYGLYKNPELTVQEAYDTVKERSRWIGPNMHLIYQLAEFKSTLSRKFPMAAGTLRARRNIGLLRTHTDSMLKPNTNPLLPTSPRLDEPNTAPLQDDQDSSPRRSASLSPPNSAQHATPMSSGQIIPGPSSAPPDMQFSPTKTTADLHGDSIGMDIVVDHVPSSQMSPPRDMEIDTDTTSSTHNDSPLIDLQPAPKSTAPSPMINPLLPGGFSSMSLRRAASAAATAPKELPSRVDPQAKAESINSVSPFHIPMDHIMTDAVPLTPSILSPRAAEFTASPFHRTVAGDLAGSSVFEQGTIITRAVEKDPRSPPTGDEKFVRSIDEMI
ncbi:hypothetical protein MMC14_004417 [Varicellaria rhodocarpa]|nr:hypothetical protein [Varicellaria rhodocarpa]